MGVPGDALETEGGVPQSTTGIIRIAINTELFLITTIHWEGGGPQLMAEWANIIGTYAS